MASKPDWEKARDWLNHENVTKATVKVPCLKDITTEFELYTYLKDGTELCRLIGVVTQGRVLDGIVYRTNSVSTLEEKNIGFFLNHLTSIKELDLKRDKIFKKKNEKVFHKFADFHIFLAGLAMLSKKLENKINVPKFESKCKETVTAYEDEEKANIYEQGDENENEHYDNLYSQQIQDTPKPTSLDKAFAELIELNNSYITKVLEVIKYQFQDKPTTPLLQKQFFRVFQLDKLINLHKKLRHKLEKMEYAYIEIGDTFEELKNDFIVYCDVVAKIQVAIEFLADQMTDNEETKTVINALEQEVGPDCSLMTLMQMIPQHIMRYHMIIETIQNFAAKAKKTDVEREARRAHKIMKNFTTHVNNVSRDFKYIQTMDDLRKEIKGVPYDNLHSFGILQFELKDVLMSSTLNKSSFKPFHLLVFNEYIVALEKKTREEFTGKVAFGGIPVKNEIEEKRFHKSFRIKDIDQITVKKQGEESFLWAKAFDLSISNQPVPEKSFVLKFNDNAEALEVERDLKKYLDACKEEIFIGSGHTDHVCKKFRADGSMENTQVRCGSSNCGELLTGLLFTAVDCITCKKTYHNECFSFVQSDESAEESEKFDDPEDLLIEKPEDLELEDFDIGEATRQPMISKLRSRGGGTFLMRYSDKREAHIIAVKTFDDDKKKNTVQYVVKTIKIHGTKYYYLDKGTSADTLLELVKKHRKTHMLYRPVTIQTPQGSDNESNAEEEEKESEDEKEGEEVKEDFSDGHIPYFFGDITSADAKKLVKKEAPGTFLVRQNDGQFKLTWLGFSGNCQHSIIKFNNGMYSLTSQKSFHTIHELTMFYECQDQSNRIALGDPLINPMFEIAEAENKTDEEIQLARKASRIEGPFNLPSYQGTMAFKEADRALQKEVDGTFIIWQTKEEDLLVSYKLNHRTKHIKIENDGSSFSAQVDGYDQIRKTSIRRLIDEMKNKGVFCRPIRSNVASRDVSRQGSISQMGGELPTAQRSRAVTESDEMGAASLLHTNTDQNFHEALQRGLTRLTRTRNPPECPFESPQASRPGSVSQISPSKFPVSGKMDHNQAEQILQNKPIGSWVLRYNMAGQERISVRMPAKVFNMKLHISPEGYRLLPRDRPSSLDDIITKLIDCGKLSNQITTIE